jgi:hypothetical protein
MSKNDSVERVKTSLEIDEHLPIQERGWKWQAIGLYFIFALVLTAAAGLYGDGPLSKKRESETFATVEYQRFNRFQSRMELKVELNSPGKPDDLTVTFPANYLKHFQVDSILPEPEKTIVNGDQLQYVFNGTGNITITFYLIPQSVGGINGSIEINNNRLDFNHFIFR